MNPDPFRHLSNLLWANRMSRAAVRIRRADLFCQRRRWRPLLNTNSSLVVRPRLAPQYFLDGVA